MFLTNNYFKSIDLGDVAHVCNHRTWEVDEDQEFKVILSCTEFEASLCYMRLCFKKPTLQTTLFGYLLACKNDIKSTRNNSLRKLLCT